MFPGGTDQTKGGGSQVGASQSSLSLEQRLQRWMELRDAGAPFEQIQAAEIEVAEAIKKAPFEIASKLPFFQQMAKKLDASQAFQQFRLPGRELVVVDRREAREGGKPAKEGDSSAKEAGKKAQEGKAKRIFRELRLKDGRLVKLKDASSAKGPGDTRGAGASGGLEQQAATERVERMLSAFERMVVARFEEGRQVAKESPDGRPSFLAKSEGQWRDFFKAFLSRTVGKKALLSEIREFLFRGLVSKGAKGVVIGDLSFTSGRVEKFVRFSILAEALARLRSMVPGESLARGALAQLTGEELMYLALAAARAKEFAFSAQEAQGRFMGSRAEAEAAAALGIPLEHQLRQKARSLRGRKGSGRGLTGDEGISEDLPYRFVPWWSWGNLARPGRLRWVTAVFYGSLLAMAILGIAMMTWRLLGGS